MRDAWPPRLGALVAEAWAALPDDARARLGRVTWEVLDPHELPGRFADAGAGYIRLRTDVPGGLLGRAIVAHELAHLYGRHDEEIKAGRLCVEQAEAIADALVFHWLGDGPARALAAHRARLR